MKKILYEKDIYHNGRGPIIEKTYYNETGTIIKAVDFINPSPNSKTKHLIFINPQVFMFTPEEVYNYNIDYSKTNHGVIINLGKSKWFNNFNPYHLQACNHYQILFYDEILDIICENIFLKKGKFSVKI